MSIILLLEFHYRRNKMKIRVTEAVVINDNLVVGFYSPVGSGRAFWIGTSPSIGDELDVEFELDEIFSWGKNIMPSPRKRPSIEAIHEVTRITAEITGGEDEECVALKLGDSIILIELEKKTLQMSGYVEVRATRVRLYPTNI